MAKAEVIYKLGNTVRLKTADGKTFSTDAGPYGDVEKGDEVEILESQKQIKIEDLTASQIEQYNPDLFQEIQGLSDSLEGDSAISESDKKDILGVIKGESRAVTKTTEADKEKVLEAIRL